MEYAILFLPLIGSVIGYLGRSSTKYFSEITTSFFVILSAILSILVFWNGIQYDVYGNYNLVWWIGIAVGAFSALVHLPIREQQKSWV